MRRASLVLLMIGCSKAAEPPPDPDAACAAAGRNIPVVLHLDAERARAIAAIVERHCRADAWPLEAQACVAAAVDHAAALKCADDHLTKAQHEMVVRDMRPVLDGSGSGSTR
jgi:hypothetical protein